MAPAPELPKNSARGIFTWKNKLQCDSTEKCKIFVKIVFF